MPLYCVYFRVSINWRNATENRYAYGNIVQFSVGGYENKHAEFRATFWNKNRNLHFILLVYYCVARGKISFCKDGLFLAYTEAIWRGYLVTIFYIYNILDIQYTLKKWPQQLYPISTSHCYTLKIPNLQCQFNSVYKPNYLIKVTHRIHLWFYATYILSCNSCYCIFSDKLSYQNKSNHRIIHIVIVRMLMGNFYPPPLTFLTSKSKCNLPCLWNLHMQHIIWIRAPSSPLCPIANYSYTIFHRVYN